jgi:N-acyl amino acid synthase of PEP-CTERM/exosortase system
MEHVHSVTERFEQTSPWDFQARSIDGDPELMAQHYRLRYQVYCVERGFLPADDYPDQQERDEFDGDSIHVGAVDALGELAGTARVIRPNQRGLPLFRYCTLFPHVRTLEEPGHVAVEISRVSISRLYARRRDEIHPPSTDPATAAARASQRRRRRDEPFLTLIKSILQGAKRAGATHLIGATEASFHRWLVHYGFPFRVSGPEKDYYGPVVPSILSLHELDDVILSGRFPALGTLPVGWDPQRWPGCGVDANVRAAADAAYRSGSQELHG